MSLHTLIRVPLQPSYRHPSGTGRLLSRLPGASSSTACTPQLFQAVLIRLVLQPSEHTHVPPLNSLQQMNVLVLGTLELQWGLGKSRVQGNNHLALLAVILMMLRRISLAFWASSTCSSSYWASHQPPSTSPSQGFPRCPHAQSVFALGIAPTLAASPGLPQGWAGSELSGAGSSYCLFPRFCLWWHVTVSDSLGVLTHI